MITARRRPDPAPHRVSRPPRRADVTAVRRLPEQRQPLHPAARHRRDGAARGAAACRRPTRPRSATRRSSSPRHSASRRTRATSTSLRWCGAGGYGDPLDRDPETVARDVAAGACHAPSPPSGSTASCSRTDGVDAGATDKLRAEAIEARARLERRRRGLEDGRRRLAGGAASAPASSCATAALSCGELRHRPRRGAARNWKDGALINELPVQEGNLLLSRPAAVRGRRRRVPAVRLPRLRAAARHRARTALASHHSGTSGWRRRTDGVSGCRHRRDVHGHRPPGRRRQRRRPPSPPRRRRSSSAASWRPSRRSRACAASARASCSAAASSSCTGRPSPPTPSCSCAARRSA